MKNITVPVPTDTYYRAHMWTGKHHDFRLTHHCQNSAANGAANSRKRRFPCPQKPHCETVEL
ncbi:hypothetical protein SBA5_450083 [Candidatus Sulfotelmatomonas gaucii]|uniref:Uncharacterized protein n=1 Tax=Candidatus Sulfuritelmatomonas gaucii TaxID=2043161 RepID=A0A2N9LMG6_9BACT|nr:hypothetical protein SBA5_450083 [Candidatus Sulfotelmatomonas gaucii]